MYKAIVYFHEFHNIDGEFTNNIEVKFDDLEDVSDILIELDLRPDDITIIDFR